MIVTNIENNRLTLLFESPREFVILLVVQFGENHTGVLWKMSFVKQLDRKTSLL